MDSNELPNAGDRAFVVHACECERGQSYLGAVVHVVEVGPADIGICTGCRTLITCTERAELGINCTGALPRHWLRRIKPLSELIAVEKKEQVPA